MDENSVSDDESTVIENSFFRPHLSDGFVPRDDFGDQNCSESLVSSKTPGPSNGDSGSSTNVPVSSFSYSEQEDRIVDDILFCMMGIEGEYIRVQWGPPFQLTIHLQIDESIRELAGRIISICGDYHTIVKYVESIVKVETSGVVRQAFVAAIRTILEEYQMYVTQLENCQVTERLSLQKMWYHVLPLQWRLNLLADSCRHCRQQNIRGGALLSYLHSKIDEYLGDTKARDMFSFLAQAAAKPYFYQLERWLFRGELVDQYEEFLIGLNDEIKTRKLPGAPFDEVEDWDRRYSIRRSMCPNFLSETAEKILNAGKCLNVISSCGRPINLRFSKLVYSYNDRHYLKIVEDAYAEAGRALVSLLIGNYGLIGHFQSLKHYFLMDRGDWMVHFMETSEDELSKPVSGISKSRIESLLVLALNSSSIAHDFLKDKIRFEFCQHSVATVSLEIVRTSGEFGALRQTKTKDSIKQGCGFDAFVLRYDAGWPLSIVFNRTAMFKYQLMFRQLLTFKRVEQQLSKTWMSRRTTVRQAIFIYKLAAFVRKYLYHASVDVIDPNWHQFMETIAIKSDNTPTFTLDHLLLQHKLFLDKCTSELLLTDSTLIICLEKIIDLCKEATKEIDGEIDVEFMEQEFSATVEDLLSHMRSLSNNKREKGWMEVAYSLGLLSL